MIYEADMAYFVLANKARSRAYAPYSQFHVGACAVDADGQTALGCNVENASYGATMCAERTAIFAAVAAGLKKITHLYLVADAQTPTFPCGLCRQVLYENNPDMIISMAGCDLNEAVTCTIKDLLPHAFGPDNLI